MRLAVNLLGLVFLYWPSGREFVITTTPNAAGTGHLSFNDGVIVWGVLSWIWIHLGANLLGHMSAAIGYARRRATGGKPTTRGNLSAVRRS